MGAWAFEHLPFSQTQGSAVASSTCSTRIASGSAVGLSTWYLPISRAPPPLSALLPPLGVGGWRSEAESPGVGRGGDPLTQASLPLSSVSQSPCLCFPPGPHGAAGHGQHHQLVAVSPAIICVPRLGGQLPTWPAAGSFGGRGQIWAREMGAQETGVGPWGSRIFCGPLPAPHPHKTG